MNRWVLALAAVAWAAPAAAAWHLFVEPHMGVTGLIFRAVEIEEAFVTSMRRQEELQVVDWSQIDPTARIVTVGRLVSYRGSGPGWGITAGLTLSRLMIGVRLHRATAEMHGYSRRYYYMSDLLQSYGQKFTQTAALPVRVVSGCIQYEEPLLGWFRVGMTAEVGALHLGRSALITGRAADDDTAFTMAVEVRLAVAPRPWLAIGAAGYGGLFVFGGTYETAMGARMGGYGFVRVTP